MPKRTPVARRAADVGGWAARIAKRLVPTNQAPQIGGGSIEPRVYRVLLALLSAAAIVVFPPSLWLAGVPIGQWPLFIGAMLLASLVVVPAFYLVGRGSEVAIGWAAINAVVALALTLLYGDYYRVGPLAVAAIVVAHTAVHGLRSGLAAAATAAIGLPLVVGGLESAFRWGDAVYSGVFLAATALIPWTASRLAGRKLLAERSLIEAELRRHAFTDPVTGLANRLLLHERLQHACDRRPRDDGSLALLFIDLDGFKAVNDRFGHGAGDAVLRQIGQRFSRRLRPADTLARLGGDEFVVVLEDISDSQFPERMAARLADSLADPFSIDDQEVYLTAAVGATTAQEGQSTDELLHAADLAMYAAKRVRTVRNGPRLSVVSAE